MISCFISDKTCRLIAEELYSIEGDLKELLTMAYEKLSVVYEYRDDPSYESDDETADDDWWKKEDDLQKEKKSGFLSSMFLPVFFSIFH